MIPLTERDYTSKSSNDLWNVYIARGILNEHPGRVLVGCVSWSSGLITVLGTVNPNPGSDRAIGYWHGGDKDAFDASVRHCECVGDVQNRQHSILNLYLDCANQINCKLSVQGNRNDIPPVCILFEPHDILHSYIYMSSIHVPPCNGFENSSNFPVEKHSFSNSSVVGERMAYILHQFLNEKCVFVEKLEVKKPEVSNAARLSRNILSFFPFIIMSIFDFIHRIFYSRFPHLKKCLSIPSFLSHLMARCRRSHHLLSLDRKHSFQCYIKYNAYSQHLLDSVIGVAILYFVITSSIPDLATTCLLDWAEDVAGKLNDLIKWLMGAPAGLKLNSPLTSMLGHFFLYHIYLWTGYLSILRSVLPWLLVFAAWSGLLGASCQLCLVQDVFSMLTLHIYCFYVYAARIFYMQTSALASLWRLFRGKKWNSLRSRVDSAAYNTDQLFVGTLCFTVLLFLLPTTALYYAVFTALRISTLAVHAVLSLLVHYISITPAYSLLLYVVKPCWVAGTVEFDMVRGSHPPSSVVLMLKTARLPLGRLLQLTTRHLSESRVPEHSWSELLSCLATGRIIFPWVPSVNPAQADSLSGMGTSRGQRTKED